MTGGMTTVSMRLPEMDKPTIMGAAVSAVTPSEPKGRTRVDLTMPTWRQVPMVDLPGCNSICFLTAYSGTKKPLMALIMDWKSRSQT